jgi:hypothetical protein
MSREGQGFSPLHVVQTGSGANAASYPMCIGGFSSRVKRPVPETVNTCNMCRDYEYVDLCIHSPYVFMA